MRLANVALLGLSCLCLLHPVSAADYAVEKLNEAPPGSALSKEIVDQLATTGVRVTRGGNTFCDLWPAKSWATIANFKPTAEISFPFSPGQFVGVVKFARKGSDFRNQDISTGLYTLRYAQQPVNGAHVGTSLTRDFCLLTQASKDKSVGVVEYETLTKQSSEAAGSAHPALFCLLKPAADVAAFPAIRHDEEHDWWIVAFQGQANAGKSPQPLAVEMVIFGKAAD